MSNRVYVVGVGAEGRASLAPRVAAVVDRAKVIVGGERLLAMFPDSKANRLVLRSDVSGVVDLIEARREQVGIVVLASGDPGFFGIAKVLVNRLGKERVEIIPNIASVQLAFARIKESWDDATFVSVHGRSMTGLVELVKASLKVAILCDGARPPSMIARALLAGGIAKCRVYVCENLGLDNERVRDVDLNELAELATAPLSLIVVIRDDSTAEPTYIAADRVGRRRGLGIPDEEFHQRRTRRGLITKAEVRLVSLARLGLGEDSVVWDIGAGCGSVAIEAALIATRGQAFAVERDTDAVELIRQNVSKFGTYNVRIVHGEAPEALAVLPDPDSVFVGGSAGRMEEILDVVGKRLLTGGRVVVNAATIETVHKAGGGLQERGFVVETTLMQVARSRELAGLTHFEALDPVFVLAARWPDVAKTRPE